MPTDRSIDYKHENHNKPTSDNVPPKPNKANINKIKYATVFSTKRKKEIPWCDAGLSPSDEGCDVGMTVGAGVVPGTVGAAVTGACVTGAAVGADVLATVGAAVVGMAVVTLSVALVVGAKVGANVMLLLLLGVGAIVVTFDAVGAVGVVLSSSRKSRLSNSTVAWVLETALKRSMTTQSHSRLRLPELQYRSFISFL